MSLQLFTSVWGESHVKMFKEASLKSLSFPKNQQTLIEAEAEWNIFTEEKFFEEIKEMVYKAIPKLPLLNLVSTATLRDYTCPIHSASLKMIKKCVDRDMKLLMCPPDTIFGDGSVHNLLKIGRERHTCVVSPHPRVLPKFLKEFAKKSSYSNQELVGLAWKKAESTALTKYEYLHRAWSEAEIGHPFQNSYVSGVSWQELEGDLYSITHWLPTVYLAHFNQNDWDFFRKSVNFGVYDHVWPSMLVKARRQRFIASSEACFIVEITEKDKNVPPVWPGSVDSFWALETNQPDHEHNSYNRQIVSTFRGGA